MRNKFSKVMLFVIAVVVGFFVIELSLHSLPVYCNCVSGSQLVEKECNRNCIGHGGCLFYEVEIFDCICEDGDCGCDWYYECEDRSRGWITTYYEYCPDCP